MANVGSSLNLTNLMEDDLSAEGEEKIPSEDTHTSCSSWGKSFNLFMSLIPA